MILVLGERENRRGISPQRRDAYGQSWTERHVRALDYFSRPSGVRTRLLSTGLAWHRGANLLWPAEAGRWTTADAERASEIAAALLDSYAAAPPEDEELGGTRLVVIVALGRRVAQALGCSDLEHFASRDVRDNVVVVRWPHPSGLARFWNDASNRAAAAESARLIMDAHEELKHGA